MENFYFQSKSDRENFVLRSASKVSLYLIGLVLNILVSLVVLAIWLLIVNNKVNDFLNQNIIFSFPFVCLLNIILCMLLSYCFQKEAIVQKIYKKYYYDYTELLYEKLFTPLVTIFFAFIMWLFISLTFINTTFLMLDVKENSLIGFTFVVVLVFSPLIFSYYMRWYKNILVLFLDKWEMSIFRMKKTIDRDIEIANENEIPINLALIKIEPFKELSKKYRISKSKLVKFIILFVKSNYRPDDLVFTASAEKGIIGYIGKINEDILKNILNARIKEKFDQGLQYKNKTINVNLEYKIHSLNLNKELTNTKDIKAKALLEKF